MAITGVNGVASSASTLTSSASAPAKSTMSFSDVLGKALDDVNGVLQQADQAAVSYAAGGSTTIDQLMVAEQQASLALDLVVQTRDRVISAYQSLMNMQM
ncbi:flagellar hook-basal body complex protein FliE [Alicyclobacillus shizuokensis]|uniref:flagellar hook-basal body complex protein FliE n=1 Tax=Alicyclobacillus shizuokensis TaxID=392014 RepID=UPI000836625A|nr:flagellar hook-basal body complex protein FliE [Alicyclobacillus shizuokensis]MCL6626447.1 flagellar hook-basal body complex protein FliE [Alicyclobacillus shizuokensis]